MNIRTNAQLIAELQKHPADALVVLHDGEGICRVLGDIGMDGTCGDGSPGQPEECLRISLTDEFDEEFEAAPPAPVAEQREWRYVQTVGHNIKTTYLQSGAVQFSTDGGKTWTDADTKGGA